MRLVKPVLFFLALCVSSFGQAVSFIGGAWSGNVTPTSATTVVRLNTSGQRVRMVVSKSEALTAPVFSAAVTTAAGSGNSAKLTVQGLQPDTQYYYGIEVAGTVRTETVSRGAFRTFPLGQASFRIAFGSCGDFRATNQSAYTAIMQERPLLFINTGDLHYSDTNSTVAEDYRVNYDNVLSHAVQGALYRSMPVAYMWDDHDYCGNDTDMSAIGRNAALATYKERVPHYSLNAGGGTLGQAFTIGRVRVLMTDQHSAATPTSQRESTSKTRLGTAQKAWLKQELITARDSGFPLVLWVTPDPWIGRAGLNEDTWGAHATERTEIANFIRDNRITNLALISGDMHGLAFDDGTNSDYATGGGAPVPVLHAAALTSEGSVKGGPYSGGAIPGSQQFGILEIYDSGGPSVACRFLGIKVGEGRRLTHIFSSSSSGAKGRALVNISTLARITTPADAIVSGFVITSQTKRSVLVRAIGPTLAAFGVNDALARPQLAVYEGDRLIATNEAWSGTSREMTETLMDAFDRAGAFRLVDETSRDAALVASLATGSYTVRVTSGDGTPGAALLEVYDLP